MKTKEFTVEVKAAEDEKPTLTAYASTFDRVPDSYGDIVARGAFAETLEEWKKSGKNIPLLFGHRTDDPMMNLGKVVSAVEDEKGLLITAEFDMENENAVKARRDVLAGTLGKMSFAYEVLDWAPVELEDGTKANELRKLKLYEVSLVPIPANQFAVVTDCKSAEIETADAEAEEKAGKRNSAADEEQLEHISQLADEIKDVVDGLVSVDDNAQIDEASEEQIEAKQACEEQIEAKNDEAIEAKEDEPTYKESEPKMANEILETIGEAKPMNAQPKSLGELAAKSVANVKRGEQFSVSTPELKVGTTETLSVYDRASQYVSTDFVQTSELHVADIMSKEYVSSNSIVYYVNDKTPQFEEAGEGDSAATTTGNVFTQKVKTIGKIVGILKESQEMVNDAPWLASAINNRGLAELKRKEDKVLIGQISGSGIQSQQIAGTLENLPTIENVIKAIKLVKQNSGHDVDCLIMSPASYFELLRFNAESSACYFMGNINTFDMNRPTILGIPVLVTDAVKQMVGNEGDAIVAGAFKAACSAVYNGGVSVDIANTNEDDFNCGRISIRIQEHVAAIVREPKAICSVYYRA